MNRIALYILSFAVMGLISCGHEHEESQSMKEAREIQVTLSELSGSIESTMKAKFEAMSVMMDTCMAKGDTVMAQKLDAVNLKLLKLQEKMDAWNEQKVSLPHDHSQCDGDHSHEEIVTDLSDEELLSIQKELKMQLEGISEEVDKVVIEQ